MFGRLFAQKPDTQTHIDLVHGGVAYKIMLKRNLTARKFTLRVRSASRDVVLTIPARSSLIAAREFVERHSGWIESRLQKLPQPISFRTGETIPLRGVDHLICHRPNIRKTIWIEANLAGSVTDPALLICVSGEIEHIERRIQDFLKREAKRDIEAAVRCHTSKIGKSARKITVRDTTSRWGSCSSKGSLNFSWRLILAPGYVLDYLAAHEVAHLVHMDHSQKFWTLTRNLAPQTQKAEAWLKSHGASLHRFGD